MSSTTIIHPKRLYPISFLFILYSMVEVQQKYRQTERQDICTQLKLLGHCPIKSITEFEQTKSNRMRILHDMMESTLSRHKKQYILNPIKTFTFSNIIAFIDTRERLWALLDIAAQPICIYDMIKIKVQNLSLYHSSMILSTKEGQLLLSWGAKKGFAERYLQKITAKNQKFKYLHFFELYEIIREEQQENEKYFFANSQITAFQDCAYSLVEDEKTIFGFPSCKKIKIGVKVSGLSLGKYHCLLWDINGIVYSWGCKSIALGYQVLPDQEFVEQPRPVAFLPPACKAYAGNNYSLAISTDGMLYEWGINKMKLKEQQNIFHPREIKIHKSKFIELKGNSDKYAALSLMGELYLWGKDTYKYISQRQQNPKEQAKDLLIPTNIGSNLGFVIDFQIEDSFIVLVTANKNIQSFSEGRRQYWNNLMNTVQVNLKNKPHFRLSESISYNKAKHQDTYGSSFTLRRFNSPIELAFEKKKAKENYIEKSIQPNRTLLELMKPLQQNHYRTHFPTENNQNIYQKPQTVKKAYLKKMHTTIDEFSSEFKRQKQYVQSLVDGIKAIKSKPKILRFNKHHKDSVIKETNKINYSYENRLQIVKKKRQINQKMFIEQVLKKVQNRSYEYRSLKRMQNEQLRKKNKECLIYKQSAQKLFIKAFLIKMLTKPTAQARQVKIASFARYLKIERIQKRIKGLFIKTRINFNMRKLHHHQVFRFFLLTMTFQQYVKRFRLKKYKQLRKKVVGQIFKSVVIQKLKIGLAACNLNIRKLQKFRDWISMVRAERKRCLKYIWKVQLLTTMKINSQNQSSTIFYLPKNIEQITFESLYQEKVSLNPLLKLHVFLNHYSIFKIKTTVFQQLFVLTQDQINKNKQKQKNFNKTRKFRIKFSEDQQDKQDRLNLIQTDIYPYSLHYNILLHPKNYDITIPEIMKVNQKWIRQERKILQKHIDLILKNHQQDYIIKRRKYDIDLANYIRRNYDSLAEKRWKYIIQYNKLDRSYEKSKKEKQVRRLMGLIGCQKFLDQDCIPQKHSILDEISKRGDSPIAPNSHIVFGSPQFKKMFKTYYDTVSTKAKQMRRAYL